MFNINVLNWNEQAILVESRNKQLFRAAFSLKNALYLSQNFLHVEDKLDRDEIFAKRVKAGKRTYFFDIKATRSEDFFLTITESKKRFNEDGTFVFEKHKIFLYKEDFQKFVEAMHESYEKMQELMPDFDFSKVSGPDGDEKEFNWE